MNLFVHLSGNVILQMSFLARYVVERTNMLAHAPKLDVLTF